MLIMGQFYPWFKFCFPLLQTQYCRFSHDITKIQTKKLLILLSFYFPEVLQQLIYTTVWFERVLCFAIEDA